MPHPPPSDRNPEYCGCNICIRENGEIELDQNDYVKKIEFVEKKEGPNDRKLIKNEIKELRGKIGEILWISLMTRPDLAFDVNHLATDVPNATVETVKKLNKLVKKAKSKRETTT